MTSRDFCFWLQGFFEVGDPKTLTGEQLDLVKRHLNLVFIHEIDPSMGNKEEQDKLNAVHESKTPPKWPDGSPMKMRC